MTDKVVSAYYSYMVDLAVLFGADRPKAETELKESLEFEMALANVSSITFQTYLFYLTICFEQISLPNEQRRNATKLYNPKTIDQLQKENPSVPWREYFSKILPPTVPIANDEVIIINVPSYLGDLEKLLSNTPKRYEQNPVRINQKL